MRRNEPHWLLTDADARTYGQALQNALRHIPIGVAQKTVDFTALFICALNFESPRIYQSMANARARRTRSSSSEQPAAPVFQFRPRTSSPQPAGAASPESPPERSEGGSGVDGFTGDGIDAPPIGGHH
jgi:hypothetical protein